MEMPTSETSAGGPALMRVLTCMFRSGAATVPRGIAWGFALGLPAGCFCFFTMSYGGGVVLGPVVALAGPFAGALVAFHLGAAAGLFRAGYRWAVLLVPWLAATVVLVPYGIYRDSQWREEEHRRLIHQLETDDAAPFLASVRTRRSRQVVRDHLEQFVVCAALHSRADILDALVGLDPRGRDGFALCGAAEYGQPAVVKHLLGEGFQPTRAHRLTGESCDPLLELVQSATSSAPCSGMDESDRFMATPTAEGCVHRAEVAELLLAAGASLDGTARVYDRPHDGGVAARTVGLVELAKESHCDALVEVLARGAH